jgi:hypothetical protein
MASDLSVVGIGVGNECKHGYGTNLGLESAKGDAADILADMR